jgi:hypothetical protein
MKQTLFFYLIALVVVSSSTTTWIIPSGYAQQTTSNVNSDSIDPNSYLLVYNLTTTNSLGNFSNVLITQDATNTTNTVIILVSEVQDATNQIPYEDTLNNLSQVWGYDLTSFNFTTIDNQTSLIAVLEESPTNMSSTSTSSQNNNTNTSSTEEGNGTKAGPQPAIVASTTTRDTDWPFALKPHQEVTAPAPVEEGQPASTPTTESNGQTESEPEESASTDETGTNEESEGEAEESEET